MLGETPTCAAKRRMASSCWLLLLTAAAVTDAPTYRSSSIQQRFLQCLQQSNSYGALPQLLTVSCEIMHMFHNVITLSTNLQKNAFQHENESHMHLRTSLSTSATAGCSRGSTRARSSGGSSAGCCTTSATHLQHHQVVQHKTYRMSLAMAG
jgi:hypothetical protein